MIPDVKAKNNPYPIALITKICFALLLLMDLAMTERMVVSVDKIFFLYVLYNPHPIATNDANNMTYVATASLCNAGIAAGVIVRLLFFAYAKNDTAIAKNPTSMRATFDLTRDFCFSTCPKSVL